MRRQQKVATVLLSAVLLMTFSGVSLFADMQSESTKEGGTLPPVAVFDATTVLDITAMTPYEPVSSVETKPYTEVAPIDPQDVATKAEEDNLPETLSGILKYKLVLDKDAYQPGESIGESGMAQDDELSSLESGDMATLARANPYLITSGMVNDPIPDQGWRWRRVRDSTQAPPRSGSDLS